MATCVFCAIIAGDIPAEKLYETDQLIVIRDIAPKAPRHLLIIPKRHIEDLRVCLPEHATLGAHIFSAAQRISHEHNDEPFRLVINTGEQVGQSIFHLHCHYLAGEKMSDL